ncbi:MAG: hypothetical protein IME92_02175 [Proteobacteria bacterium]|nr:hypothetical protein [Pseudomonadota bacterium]
MAEIIAFRSEETPKLNYPEIEILLNAMGIRQGLRVFERAMFEISDKLCQLELAVYDGDVQTARRCAKSLRTLSPQIGLESLAHVAGDMINAIDCNDPAVLPVICHRMVCLGEASLFQLSELPRVLPDK